MGNNIKKELFFDFMKKEGIGKLKFCKLCNISLETFNKIILNKYNYRVSALFKIAKVIKVEVYQMFE